jgi:predicted RNA-binding Zn-ribbon protein involved in translation (DUF1610 family)
MADDQAGRAVTPKELIMQVTCPSCGAGKQRRCFSVKNGKYLTDEKYERYHYCHHARWKLYEKRGRPIDHDNWPVTRLKSC